MSESSAKSLSPFLTSVALTTLVLVTALVALNAVVDPWRYLFDSSLASYDSDGRQQNPGLIRHKDYGTIVLGTSMTQNFKPDDLQALFDEPALVLSISAGTAREQLLTARKALQRDAADSRRAVSTAIWGIHPAAFSVPAEATKGNAFPAYLYDQSVLNDFFYLFNWSNTEKSLEDLQGGSRPGAEEHWRNLQYWGHRFQYGCPQLMQLQMSKRGLPAPEDDTAIAVEQIRRTLQANLLVAVDSAPETDFYLFFPPMSQLYWQLLQEYQPRRLVAFLQVYQELVALLLDRPNVRIFDFTGYTGVVDDLQHYKDITHFSPAISRQLLDDMKADRYRVEFADDYRPAIMGLLLDGDGVQAQVQRCLQQPVVALD